MKLECGNGGGRFRFGKGNRQTKGYVTGMSKTCDYDLSKVKEIADISQKQRGDRGEADRAGGMDESTNYGGTMIQALKTVLADQAKRECQDQKVCSVCCLAKRRAEAQLHYYLAEESEGESKTSGSTSGGSGH